MSISKDETNVVRQAIGNARRSMLTVFIFSFVVSLLLLTSPMFMLQVYDRVLLSRSSSTLLGLFSVAMFLLVTLLFIEIVRNFLLNRISVRFDKDLSEITFSEVMSKGSVSRPLHDLNAIRSFLNAPFILAIFDLPWLPAYLALVYFLHPMLGHIGLVGACILFLMAISNDRLTRDASQQSNEHFGSANAFVEHSSRNKDAVLGMGMLRSLSLVWSQYQAAGLGFHIKSSDRNAVISAFAKTLRQIIQVSVLAMGGYLAIQDITSPGVMIAASIIIGRALAPIEQSIQGWRAYRKVKESYQSLEAFLDSYEAPKAGVPLPVPLGKITFQNVVSVGCADDEQESQLSGPPKVIIKNMSCEINAGESVGITGPSGSGKSTLARLILGILKPVSGAVRVDGAELTQDVQRQFSPYFGFLPQEVGLFDGTVAENIARFCEDDKEKVVTAAKLAGAHELILSLPEGYETPVGPSGIHLSGGQKQRVGLARAVYNMPSIIVLDEPTSNLDNDGRLSLLQTIKDLKGSGKTVILIAHQPSLFSGMDKIGLVVDGQLQKFGPAAEVIQELNPRKMMVNPEQAKPTKASVVAASTVQTPPDGMQTSPDESPQAVNNNRVKLKKIKRNP
jgi:ATP-binding cassette subfamily C protein EexD